MIRIGLAVLVSTVNSQKSAHHLQSVSNEIFIYHSVKKRSKLSNFVNRLVDSKLDNLHDKANYSLSTSQK